MHQNKNKSQFDIFPNYTKPLKKYMLRSKYDIQVMYTNVQFGCVQFIS